MNNEYNIRGFRYVKTTDIKINRLTLCMPVQSTIRERRRLRALELHKAGWRGIDIARTFGVSHAAVSQWLRAAREGGPEALHSRRATGRPPRLTDRHKRMVTAMIREDARHFGFAQREWQPWMLQRIITKIFGVTYSRQHVGTILRRAQSDPSRLPKMLTVELSDLLSNADVTVIRGRFKPRTGKR